MSNSLPSSLEHLSEIVSVCQQCKLCKTRTNTVFGDGNEKASLMFVGEGPGEEEDKSGFPFVGKSGQLLSKMLDTCLGMTRDQIYIANIVKCRPPENRDPDPEEVLACIGYLTKQIEIVKPKVIVTLGRVASQTLLATNEKIGKLRGLKHEFNGTVVIPTWHPSYLLRKPMARWDTVEDMKLVRQELNLPEKLDTRPN